LPYHFREREAAEVFERYGRLRNISVGVNRRTGQSKGYAFVEFEDRRDAEEAFDRLQGYTIEGRKLRLDWDVGLEKKGGPYKKSPRRYSRSRSPRKYSRSPKRYSRTPPKRSPSPDRGRSRSKSPERGRSKSPISPRKRSRSPGAPENNGSPSGEKKAKVDEQP